jgi:hypothetical protein
MYGKNKSWVHKGKYFKPLAAIWSNNPRKAEKTIKSFTPKQKRTFARSAAIKYKKSNYW